MKKKYKPIAQKVQPIIGELLEKFCICQNIISDPLADISILDPNPPPFKPTNHYTQD
jgi:hypothetical protein